MQTEVSKRNIRLLYGQGATMSGGFSFGLRYFYFLSIGFSSYHQGLLNSLFSLSRLMAEVPCGIFADRFKRKYALMIGAILLVFSFIGYILNANPIWIAFCFALNGLGYSFCSGADAALLYENSDIKTYKNIRSRGAVVGLTFGGITPIIGAFLYKLSWDYVYLSMALSSFASFLFAMFLVEGPRKVENKERVSILGRMHEFFIKSNDRTILLLFLGGNLISASVMGVANYYVATIRDSGLSIFETSLTIGFCRIPLIILHRILSKNEIKGNYEKVYLPLGFALFLLLLTPYLVPSSFTVVAVYILIMLVNSLRGIFSSDYVNRVLPSEIRASALSVTTLIHFVVLFGVNPTIGWLIDNLGSSKAFAISSTLPVLGTILLAIYFKIRPEHHIDE